MVARALEMSLQTSVKAVQEKDFSKVGIFFQRIDTEGVHTSPGFEPVGLWE